MANVIQNRIGEFNMISLLLRTVSIFFIFITILFVNTHQVFGNSILDVDMSAVL